MRDLKKEVLEYFPKRIRDLLSNKLDEIEEIRIRQAKNIFLKTYKEVIEINYIVSSNDILEILQKVCEYSLYSYQNQIAEGYITVKGGHRIGITGTCVVENGKIINIKYINSLNFRIARQIIRGRRKYSSRNNKWKYYMEYNYCISTRVWKNNNFKRYN